MDQLVLDILSKPPLRTASEALELINYFESLAFFQEFLKGVDQDVLINIFQSIQVEEFYPKQTIFLQGDLSNNKMYIIIKGKVDVIIHKNGQTINVTLSKGQHFGEKALVEKGGRRMATIVSQDQTKLLILKRADYLIIRENIKRRQETIRDIMMDTIPEVNKIVSLETVEQLTYCFHKVTFRKNEQIITDDEEGDDLYILTDGTCEIAKRVDFKILQRNQVKKKQCVDKIEKSLYIKICLSNPFELLGVDCLIDDKEKVQQLYERHLQTTISPETFDELNLGPHHGKYWYKVTVLTQQATFLRLKKKDLLMKFPKECVPQLKFQFINKNFTRYQQNLNAYSTLQNQLEDQDKKIWLQPEKHIISLKRESTYLKRLYSDFLLSNHGSETTKLPSIRRDEKQVQAKNQHRIPDTFDFGRESMRKVEIGIINELQNRNLISKNEALKLIEPEAPKLTRIRSLAQSINHSKGDSHGSPQRKSYEISMMDSPKKKATRSSFHVSRDVKPLILLGQKEYESLKQKNSVEPINRLKRIETLKQLE